MAWLSYIVIIVAGAIAGSFLNVLIHRGPAMWGLVEDETRRGNLAFPGSYCPTCAAPLKAWQLIPVISFVFLGGKCGQCGAAIPVRYLLVELAGVIAAVTAFLLFGLSFEAVSVSVFFWLLIGLAVIDWETGYLPDALTFTLIFSGLSVNMIDALAPLPDALIGAAAGYVSFRLIGAIFYRLRGIEGLGQGDAKLLAGLGAWLGGTLLPVIVFTAALLGIGAVIIQRLRGKDISRETAIAFGPALAAAGALALIVSAL